MILFRNSVVIVSTFIFQIQTSLYSSYSVYEEPLRSDFGPSGHQPDYLIIIVFSNLYASKINVPYKFVIIISSFFYKLPA